MKFLTILPIIIFGIFIAYQSGIFSKLSNSAKASDIYKNPQLSKIIKNTCKNIRGDRWDMRQLEACCEQPDLINKFITHLSEATPKLCFRWILEESPEILCTLAIMSQEDNLAFTSEPGNEFMKFMREPGAEVVLTEASYRGYAPAMSILASNYENNGRMTEAEYWRKVGVAHANPTSLLLRGLDLMIKGKLNGNCDILTKRGQELIILSHMLGEEIAHEVPGFEKLISERKLTPLDQEEILDIICEIEGDDNSSALKFIEKIKNSIVGGEVLVSDLLNHTAKINEILDDPKVSVTEIRHFLRLRKMLVDEIVTTQANTNANDFLKSFEKAELAWRYQRVSGGEKTLNYVLLPIITGE